MIGDLSNDKKGLSFYGFPEIQLDKQFVVFISIDRKYGNFIRRPGPLNTIAYELINL